MGCTKCTPKCIKLKSKKLILSEKYNIFQVSLDEEILQLLLLLNFSLGKFEHRLIAEYISDNRSWQDTLYMLVHTYA